MSPAAKAKTGAGELTERFTLLAETPVTDAVASLTRVNRTRTAFHGPSSCADVCTDRKSVV